MADAPDSPWDDLFSNLKGQGNAFNQLISPSNRYYAFLSKADLVDERTNTYDILFELMPKEWAENAFFAGKIDIQATAPTPPATCYHVPFVSWAEIAQMLHLKDPNELIEGSWYEVQLAKSTSEEDTVVGYLYDYTLETDPNAPAPPQ